MLVVADTSPLNYLVWIEAAGILPKLYGEVIIPPEVRDELLAMDAPSVVRAWANRLPDWIEVQAPDAALRDDPRWRSLDLGERAAIALATVRQPSVLLLDEAARLKLIALPDALERLMRTSFRYPKAIVARLLEEDARRS